MGRRQRCSSSSIIIHLPFSPPRRRARCSGRPAPPARLPRPPRAHHGCERRAPSPPAPSPPPSPGRLRGQPAPGAASTPAAEPRAAAPARVGSAAAHRAAGHHSPQRRAHAAPFPRLHRAAALPHEQDRPLVREAGPGGDTRPPGALRPPRSPLLVPGGGAPAGRAGVLGSGERGCAGEGGVSAPLAAPSRSAGAAPGAGARVPLPDRARGEAAAKPGRSPRW